MLRIFRLHATAFEKLCTTGYRMERCFQLMGNITGKFPTYILCIDLLCNIEKQYNHAARMFTLCDRADIYLIGMSAIGKDCFAMLSFRCRIQSFLKFDAPFQCQNIASKTVRIGMKKLLRLRVNA